MKKMFIPFLLAALLLFSGCAKATPESTPDTTPAPSSEATPEPTPMPDMEITSAGIVDGQLGIAYGDKGEQFADGIPSRSVPLTVSYIPEGTAMLALTMIDPDGGDWVHWLAVGFPIEGTGCEIPENAGIDWSGRLIQGQNDFGPNGYGGPTPPSGVHNYVITVYALSDTLELSEGFSLDELTRAMDGKILAQAVISGTYAR